MADVFNIIEKENMDKILAEQGFQQTGCTTSECAVQMGKILNTQQMITGKFGKLENKFILTISIIDVETAKIVYSDSQSSKSIDNIKDDVGRLVDRVIDNVGGKDIERKTFKEKLLRKYRDIRKRVTHRKNKLSIAVNYGRPTIFDMLYTGGGRHYDLAVYWSPLNYVRFGVGIARTFDSYNVVNGRIDTASFNVNLDCPSIAEIFNYILTLGAQDSEPSTASPIFWRLTPSVSYGIGVSHPYGSLRDYRENVWYPAKCNYLYTQRCLGFNFILSKNIIIKYTHKWLTYHSLSPFDILDSDDNFDLIGIEYTF